MTDSRDGSGSGLPKARSIHRRWPGLIWAVPLAALLVVGWLGLSAITERGIDVVVTFDSAVGVTPSDTKVMVQGVQAGHVTHVRVAEDGMHVDVTLRLDPHESVALNTATRARGCVCRNCRRPCRPLQSGRFRSSNTASTSPSRP